MSSTAASEAVAFQRASAPSWPAVGLIGGLGLEVAAGFSLGLLIGCLLRPEQAKVWARSWLADGGHVVGAGFGLGLGLADGLLIGLAAAGLAALLAGAAYGLGLLGAASVRSWCRWGKNGT